MKPKIIAEIGCNHKGDISTAFEMIDIAADYCGVDAVKFQKRNNKELLTESQYNTPHIQYQKTLMERHMACTENF